MLPPSIFSSRQFTAANVLTFVVYAALGGVFFLLVVFLQVGLGYSPIAAGAASLPVTALMLLLSSRAGALAERIGPRAPLTVGSAVIAVGMWLMSEIEIGDSYVTAVLPAVVVFGLGLSLVVAPITMTVLAAADPRHAGVASGVNNAVARTAGLAAVAALPLRRRPRRRGIQRSGGACGRLPDRHAGLRRTRGGRIRARLRDDQRRGPRGGGGAGPRTVPGGDRAGSGGPLRGRRHPASLGRRDRLVRGRGRR